MTATDAQPPSSRASYQCPRGISGSPIRPWGTPSWIASSTMPTASSSKGNPCVAGPLVAPHRLTSGRKPRPHSPRPQKATSPRPASIGIGGRLQSEAMASIVGIRNRTGVQPNPPPLHHRRSRDPEALRCSTATQAPVNRADHTLPEVEGKRLRHGVWLPSPAATLNHDPHFDGSPRAIAWGSERLQPWPFPVKHRTKRV